MLTTMITYALIYYYDNGSRSCVNCITHTRTRTEHRTYFISDLVSSQTAFTWSIDNMCMRRRTGEGLINLVRAFTWSIDNMCMRRRTGEGLINLVSAFTWSTDDKRMRIGTGAGLIHVHLAGVGLIA